MSRQFATGTLFTVEVGLVGRGVSRCCMRKPRCVVGSTLMALKYISPPTKLSFPSCPSCMEEFEIQQEQHHHILHDIAQKSSFQCPRRYRVCVSSCRTPSKRALPHLKLACEPIPSAGGSDMSTIIRDIFPWHAGCETLSTSLLGNEISCWGM
jgi:hypothetical protein